MKKITALHPETINYEYGSQFGASTDSHGSEWLVGKTTPYLLACAYGDVRILKYLVTRCGCDTSATEDMRFNCAEHNGPFSVPIYANPEIRHLARTNSISEQNLATHPPIFLEYG